MDTTKWFHLVGLISAVALGIGFVAALVSVGLSWRINQQQELELANVRKEAAQANEKAENERLTRIKLEESLAPRAITITNKTNDELKLFAGTKVFMLSVDDQEARSLVGQLRVLFDMAGWNIIGTAQTKSPLPDWVEILSRTMTKGFDTPPNPAAELLGYQLKDCNIQTQTHQALTVWPEGVPDDAVFVQIGLKPQPYFTDKMMEESSKNFDENTRQQFQEAQRRAKEGETKYLEYQKENKERVIERQKQLLNARPQKAIPN